MKKNKLFYSMFASGLFRPVAMVISYIYVPVVLSYLGQEKYGVWTTILSILSWISLFDVGIGNGLRNKLTTSIANRNDDESRKLVSSAYGFIAIIMSLVTIGFCLVAALIDWEKLFGVANVGENLTLIVCISAIFVGANFVLSLCKNVLFALHKAAEVSAMEVVVQSVNLFAVLALKRVSSGNLFFLAVAYGLSMLSVNLVFSMILYCKKRFLRPSFYHVDIAVGKGILSLGIQFFIIQICGLVLFTTDNLIISILYGAKEVTPYSIVNKVFNGVNGVFVAFLAPVWSGTTKAKAEEQWDYIEKMVSKLRKFLLPFFFLTIILALFFEPLTYMWLGTKLSYTQELVFLGAVYGMLAMWCNTHAYIANGLELMKMSVMTAVSQAVVNIPASLFFAEFCGMQATGVLLGTVAAMSISAVVQPVFVHKYIKDCH